MFYILDSSAIIAALVGEPGGEIVIDLLERTENHFLVHAVNVIEVCHWSYRYRDPAFVINVGIQLRAFGVRTVDRMTERFCREAAALRYEIQRISLADCVCVALTRHHRATVLTSDRGEFTAVREMRVCKVRFIR